jgi:hypothetical protein
VGSSDLGWWSDMGSIVIKGPFGMDDRVSLASALTLSCGISLVKQKAHTHTLCETLSGNRSSSTSKKWQREYVDAYVTFPSLFILKKFFFRVEIFLFFFAPCELLFFQRSSLGSVWLIFFPHYELLLIDW